MSSAEQQQITASDNTGAQMQTAEAGGISGGDRMGLYQDYKTMGGQASNNEKSFSEQSMKDSGQSTLEFDNVFSKEASQFGKDGPGQQGTKDSLEAGQQKDGTSGNQKDGLESGQQSTKDGKNDYGSDAKDYNGKKDPYTKEALEGKQDFSPGGDKDKEKPHEGGHPGAPKDSDGKPMHEGDTTSGGKDGAPMQPGEVKEKERKDGATGTDGSDGAQRQSSASVEGKDQEGGLQPKGLSSGDAGREDGPKAGNDGTGKPDQPKEPGKVDDQRNISNNKSDKLEAQEDMDSKSNAQLREVAGEKAEAQEELGKRGDSEGQGDKKEPHHDDKSGQHEQDWDKQQKEADEKAKAETGESKGNVDSKDGTDSEKEFDPTKNPHKDGEENLQQYEPKMRQEGSDAAEKQNWSNTRKSVQL